jgi:predicted HicB family RNase H-like nuclease
MKIYYCANLEKMDDKKWEKKYISIHRFLVKNGVSLVSNVEKKMLKGENEARKSISYDQIEAVIIEGTHIASDTVYIIATALAYKKPVLYLMEKGHQIPDQLSYIRKDKNLGKNFYLKFYKSTGKEVEKVIFDFLGLLESGSLIKEKVNVKFTLRISPRIERYLNWKALNIKKSKAQYVRDVLNKTATEDKNYKSFLKKTEQMF